MHLCNKACSQTSPMLSVALCCLTDLANAVPCTLLPCVALCYAVLRYVEVCRNVLEGDLIKEFMVDLPKARLARDGSQKPSRKVAPRHNRNSCYPYLLAMTLTSASRGGVFRSISRTEASFAHHTHSPSPIITRTPPLPYILSHAHKPSLSHMRAWWVYSRVLHSKVLFLVELRMCGDISLEGFNSKGF